MNLPSGLFKAFDSTLVALLAALCTKILESGEYPQSWSTGIICPIHKSGAKDDPNNYRGITLLNIMGKIITAVLCNRITEWATSQNILPQSQFGFRKNRRSTDCLFIVNALVEKATIERNPLFVCYVDFRKAFTSVDRTLLWKRLVQLGINRQTLTILQSMYSKLIQG